MKLTFGSLFAGIGGLDLGLERSGMQCRWQVEIDDYCRKVLARHWPNVVRFSDVQECGKQQLESVDVVCGGWPCQDLSVAGRRKGLAGKRSGLFREVVRVLEELQPKFFLLENVPGLLSSNEGKDFRFVLEELAQCGYVVAYRVFDARYFGVPQRRRRVFLVGSFGDGRAAEILFESEGVQRNLTPKRKAKTDVAGTLESSFGKRSGSSINPYQLVAAPLTSGKCNGRSAGRRREDDENLVVGCLDRHMGTGGVDGNAAQANHLITYQCQGSNVGPMGHLRAGNGNATGGAPFVAPSQVAVRRLMPLECERLMGLPDDWTRFDQDEKELSDNRRYQMCGNSVVVPVIEWIGRRVVEAAEKV